MINQPSTHDRSIARYASEAGMDAVQLIPLNGLGRMISKLAPNLGVRAFANPSRRTIVVFTFNHWYQFPAAQFDRNVLRSSPAAAAYAIVSSVPELRDRMNRAS